MYRLSGGDIGAYVTAYLALPYAKIQQSNQHALMSADGFLTFLYSFSIRPSTYSVTSPWGNRIHAIAIYTFLQIWRIYKFAHRYVTGRGAIERACRHLLGEDALKIEEWSCLFGTREARRSVWRIGMLSLLGGPDLWRHGISAVEGRGPAEQSHAGRNMGTSWSTSRATKSS